MKRKMKSKFLISPLGLALGLFAFACQRAELAFDRALIKPDAYDVVDYFLLLPHKTLPQETTNARRKLLETANQTAPMSATPVYSMDILDRANGYLRLSMEGSGQTDRYEIAYWTQSGKPDTVGVNYTSIGMPGPSSKPAFYRFKDNEWTVITTEVFPESLPERFGTFQEVVFPQRGTDIVIRSGNSDERMVLHWQDGRFSE